VAARTKESRQYGTRDPKVSVLCPQELQRGEKQDLQERNGWTSGAVKRSEDDGISSCLLITVATSKGGGPGYPGNWRVQKSADKICGAG